jgi:hypothetical protein
MVATQPPGRPSLCGRGLLLSDTGGHSGNGKQPQEDPRDHFHHISAGDYAPAGQPGDPSVAVIVAWPDSGAARSLLTLNQAQILSTELQRIEPSAVA